MFREHESTIAWKAGFLAFLVHIVLLGALVFSFNWKAAHTVVSVSEVELWEALPATKSQAKPIKKPKPPKVKLPEPQLKPIIEEVKPEPETPKVDIELEKKQKAEQEKKKQAEAKKKKQEAERKKQLAALQKDMLDDQDPQKQAQEEALKKLQAEMRGENVKLVQPASQGVVNEFMAKIQAKIRGNVNKALCGDGDPELVFKVNLLPTGQFVSPPALSKSSGSEACDDAVERAIIASEPFPLPTDPDVLAEFRKINLTFRPNDR